MPRKMQDALAASGLALILYSIFFYTHETPFPGMAALVPCLGTALFILSAIANEIVWRTQSETFWVVFETLVMPVVVLAFFLGQIRLFVDYATWGASKKKA